MYLQNELGLPLSADKGKMWVMQKSAVVEICEKRDPSLC